MWIIRSVFCEIYWIIFSVVLRGKPLCATRAINFRRKLNAKKSNTWRWCFAEPDAWFSLNRASSRVKSDYSNESKILFNKPSSTNSSVNFVMTVFVSCGASVHHEMPCRAWTSCFSVVTNVFWPLQNSKIAADLRDRPVWCVFAVVPYKVASTLCIHSNATYPIKLYFQQPNLFNKIVSSSAGKMTPSVTHIGHKSKILGETYTCFG